MIIAHEHKSIFLKTNMTTGTSNEIVLSKSCGEDDIITPVSPADEAVRSEIGCPCARNYMVPFSRCSHKDRRHCRDKLTDTERGQIGEIFRDEINLPNYAF